MKALLPSILLACLIGCEFLDAAMGVKVDAKTGVVTVDPAGGTVGAVAGAVKDAGSGTPVGLAGTGVLLLINLYQAMRQRSLRNALVSTATAVEDFAKSPEGAEVGKVLKSRLANQHGLDNVGPIMGAIVKQVSGS